MDDSRQRRDLVALARDDVDAFERAMAGQSDELLDRLTDDLEEQTLYRAAESVYRVLISRHPQAERHRSNLALNLYYRQRDGARAEEFLRDATREFPDSATLAVIRGTNLAWGLGRHQAALPEYARAVELAPDDAVNQGSLAWCLLWLGEIAPGLEHTRRSLDCKVEQSDESRLGNHLHLYLFAAQEERPAALENIARLIARGARFQDWDVSGLVERAREQGHPESERLADLVRVLDGDASPLTLHDWPAWQLASPGVEAVWALSREAARVNPDALFEAARAEDVTVSSPTYPFSQVPFDTVYANAQVFSRAIADGKREAAQVALRALSRLDGERHVELALDLLATRVGNFQHAAAVALTRSRSERALSALVAGFEPDGDVNPFVIALSVHPAVAERARAMLAEAGLDDFIPRPRPDIATWLGLSAGERRALAELSPVGARPREVRRAQRALTVLGLRRDIGSLDLLVRIFEHHPDDWLREASAHALARFDDSRAHEVLDRAWADADTKVGPICVRAAVERDLAGAWARFAPHVEAVLNAASTPNDETIVYRLLDALHGGGTPRVVEPARDPLSIEPRFYEVAARLRRSDRFGDRARAILELLPRSELDALIERFPDASQAGAKRARVMRPGRRDFVARYQAGEHSVWNELVRHSAAVNEHADLHEEAMAVAHLLMKRVRQNADRVRATLIAAGASLADEDAPVQETDLGRLVKLVGRLPVALHAFWTTVGSIQLVPKHAGKSDPSYGPCELEKDGISLIALDPLEVSGPDIGWQLEEYEAECARTHPELVQPLALSIAPDFLHKQNISGGPPYSVILPASLHDAVDPDLLDERHETTVVEYLRICFASGGFPLLEVADLPIDDIHVNDRIAFKDVQGPWGPPAARLRAQLCRDLIPF
jgi:hypothetical protein